MLWLNLPNNHETNRICVGVLRWAKNLPAVNLNVSMHKKRRDVFIISMISIEITLDESHDRLGIFDVVI